MSIESIFSDCNVPEEMSTVLLDVLARNQVKNVKTLAFISEERLGIYFEAPIHVDVMKAVLKKAKESVAQVEEGHERQSNTVVFDMDFELLLHDFFKPLSEELQTKHCFMTCTRLIHYCSHILLRDNPGRRFSHADYLVVCKRLLVHYPSLFPAPISYVLFCGALGARNSNQKYRKRDSIKSLMEDLNNAGKRSKPAGKCQNYDPELNEMIAQHGNREQLADDPRSVDVTGDAIENEVDSTADDDDESAAFSQDDQFGISPADGSEHSEPENTTDNNSDVLPFLQFSSILFQIRYSTKRSNA